MDGDLISIEDGDLLCFLTTALVLCAMTELVRTRLAALPKLAMSGGPGSSGPVHAHAPVEAVVADVGGTACKPARENIALTRLRSSEMKRNQAFLRKGKEALLNKIL